MSAMLPMIPILFLSTVLSLLSATTTFSNPPMATESTNSMVVTDHAIASRVGLEILKKGGNAIDAAVAIGYALAVVQPCCGNLGGGGFMLLRLAQGNTIFLNFREKAPLAAHQAMYEGKGPEASLEGYLAVALPGTVHGLETALKNYGSLPRETIMAPAIELADKGFELQQTDIDILSNYTNDFKKTKEVSKIFMKSTAKGLIPYQPGDRLVQTDLANTLQLILKQGPQAFYLGSIAQAIIKASQTQGGMLSLEDFKAYFQTKIEPLNPLQCHYRGYQIVTAPLPSGGGIALCQMLNRLEQYPLTHLGSHSLQSYVYILEAMKQAFSERKLLGNPNTTHYAVVDSFGNWVLVTYTLNSLFGAKIIAENTGFFLNNEMDDFTTHLNQPNQFDLEQGKANQIEPGKIPLSSMCPTIVMRDQSPVLALGAAGGPKIITANLQTFLNIIDFKMGLNEAVNAPRFHLQSRDDIILTEPNTFTQTMIKQLKKKGYTLKITENLGIEEAIQRDPKRHLLQGVSDHRRLGGLAIGD